MTYCPYRNILNISRKSRIHFSRTIRHSVHSNRWDWVRIDIQTDTQTWKHNIRQFHSVHLADTIIGPKNVSKYHHQRNTFVAFWNSRWHRSIGDISWIRQFLNSACQNTPVCKIPHFLPDVNISTNFCYISAQLFLPPKQQRQSVEGRRYLSLRNSQSYCLPQCKYQLFKISFVNWCLFNNL